MLTFEKKEFRCVYWLRNRTLLLEIPFSAIRKGLCKFRSSLRNVIWMSDGREIIYCLFDVSLIRARINTTTGTTLTFQSHSISKEKGSNSRRVRYLTVDNKMFFINSPQPFCCLTRMLAHRVFIQIKHFIAFDFIAVCILSKKLVQGTDEIAMSRFDAVVKGFGCPLWVSVVIRSQINGLLSRNCN